MSRRGALRSGCTVQRSPTDLRGKCARTQCTMLPVRFSLMDEWCLARQHRSAHCTQLPGTVHGRGGCGPGETQTLRGSGRSPDIQEHHFSSHYPAIHGLMIPNLAVIDSYSRALPKSKSGGPNDFWLRADSRRRLHPWRRDRGRVGPLPLALAL